MKRSSAWWSGRPSDRRCCGLLCRSRRSAGWREVSAKRSTARATRTSSRWVAWRGPSSRAAPPGRAHVFIVAFIERPDTIYTTFTNFGSQGSLLSALA